MFTFVRTHDGDDLGRFTVECPHQTALRSKLESNSVLEPIIPLSGIISVDKVSEIQSVTPRHSNLLA